MGNSTSNTETNYKTINNEFNSLNNDLTITIVGNTSAGKSSFLNSLIDKNLLPVSYKAQTAKPLKIIHTNSNTDELYINHTKITSSIREELNSIDKHMRDNTDSHFVNSQLILKTNIKLLSQNNLDLDAIEIYDMPGFSENNGFFNEETTNIIKKSKLILFMIDITKQDEINIKINYARTLKLNENIIVVANKTDACDDSLDLIKKDIHKSFKNSGIILDMDKIIPISVKNNINIDLIFNQLKYRINLSKVYISNKVIELYYNMAKIFFTTNNDSSNSDIILPARIKNNVDVMNNRSKTLVNILLMITGALTAMYNVPIGLSIFTLSTIINQISKYKTTNNPYEILLEINKFSGFNKYKTTYINSSLLQHDKIYIDKLFAVNEKHVIYEGGFLNIKFHDNGTLYYPNNNKFMEGEFFNGEINGCAKIYHPNSKLIFDGKIKRIEKIKSIVKTKIKGTYYSINGNNEWSYYVNHVF